MTTTTDPRPLLFSTRRRRTLANAVCGAMTGAACVTGATLTPEGYQLATAGGGLALTGASLGWGHFSWRTLHRREVMASLRRAIAPQAGAGAKVTARGKWTSRWGGLPQQLKIRYDTVARADDPAWLDQLLGSCRRVLGDQCQVISHDLTRGVLLVGVVDPSTIEPEPEVDPRVARLDKTLSDLIGETSDLRNTELDNEGQISRFKISHDVAAKMAAKGYRTRIERTISEVLPGRWRATWNLEEDTATFETMPSFPDAIDNPRVPIELTDSAALLAAYKKVRIPYGVDADGNEMTWRPAKDPMAMNIGATGTGKTVAMHTMLEAITANGWAVWVVDGKAIEFLGWRSWPNVQIVATTIEEQIAVLERAWRVMEARYAKIVAGQSSEDDFEPLFVFLDEYADFKQNLLAWYADVKVKGDPSKPAVLGRAGSIARKGRTARVHLVFGLQRPDAEYFGGDMRDNFRQRISMGRLSPQAALMMWESPAVGVTVPRACQGRCTTVNDAGEPVEAQIYWTPDPRKTDPGSKDAELLERLRPTQTMHPRFVIEPPKPHQVWDDKAEMGTEEPPTYSDYVNARWHLAADRPDLDVLQRAPGEVTDGRAASSPTALIFEEQGQSASRATRGKAMVATAGGGSDEGPPEPVATDDDGAHSLDGYDPATEVSPEDLEIGWLVQLEEGGPWVTVDEEPTEDPMDTDQVLICWRDDRDDSGSESVPVGTPLPARLPVTVEA